METFIFPFLAAVDNSVFIIALSDVLPIGVAWLALFS